MVGPEEDLLRRLGEGDGNALGVVVALPAGPGRCCTPFDGALSLKTKMLVRLAALVAVDAPTVSIQWCAELAACAGADIDELTGVLVTIAPDVGVPRVVSCAPRLALAVGYELEVEGWDGS
jgi:alkylhydroperoxidase/carboxymuconolactone decarboxylase family protein YurZ